MELATTLYQIVQIPRYLYESWKSIVYNMPLDSKTNRDISKDVVFTLLKTWFRKHHPADKLCAFEEISTQQATALGIEQGFYLKIRKMTPEELNLSMQYMNTPDDPQFILELNDIPELQLLFVPRSIAASIPQQTSEI